jgi:hypothetical protein
MRVRLILTQIATSRSRLRAERRAGWGKQNSKLKKTNGELKKSGKRARKQALASF